MQPFIFSAGVLEKGRAGGFFIERMSGEDG
jgi:hypothetical protein